MLYYDQDEAVNAQLGYAEIRFFRDKRVGRSGGDGQYKTERRSCMSESYRQKSLDFEYTKLPDVAAKRVHH